MEPQTWLAKLRRRCLRTRQPSLRLLIIALIVVLVLPFIGSALFVIVRLSDAEHQTRETQNLGIARAFSSEVDRQLLSAEAALRALATSPRLEGGDLAAFYRQSMAVADQHGARIVLADAEGHQLFNTIFPFGTPLPESAQASLVQTTSATQRTHISDLFVGSSTGESLVGAYIPVIEAGSVRYILVMAFRPERLSRFFAEQHVPDDWTIAIVDRNGTLIGRNRALDRFLGNPVTADLKAAIDAAREGLAILHTKDGMEVYTAFTRSAFSGWTVAFGIPRAIVEAPLRHSLVEVGIAGVVVVMLCGSIALLTARRISRSMTTLSAAALALGNGEQLPQLIPTVKEMDDVIASLRIAAAALTRRSDERNRAEEALRESEQRFRDIAEVGGDWIWESDADHRFTLFAGGSLESMARAGVTPAATLGKTRWQVAGADPEVDAQWRQHKADLDAHRPVRRFEYSIVARSGARLYFSVSGKPVFDETETFCGYRGTATNVTDTVEAFQRAEQAEARLRDAVDSISEGFVIYDRDDRLVSCNDSYRRLYPQGTDYIVPGVRYEDIVRGGLARGNFIDAQGREEEWLAERMRQHRELAVTVEQQLADGRWVLVSERRMSDGGTAGLRVDITALKAVQAALRESEERLNRAQRISGVGSMEQDPFTRRLKWSAETCRIFGVDRDQVPDTIEYFYGFVHPDDREKVRIAASQLPSGVTPPPLEYRIIRPDGSVRVLCRDSEVICDTAGRPVRRIITFKDITEVRAAQAREKELERQLMHSQKLEALGTLAGGVAHDLNNTLVPILALSKLALDELPESSPVRADIETIVRASERARDLVKQVLAFSRKRNLLKQAVDLALVTREALKMLRASLPTSIQIIEQIRDIPPVFGNEGELHQIVVNLVTNAAHAIGGAAGRITVSIWSAAESPASPQTRGDGPVVCLSIADTGCGMDEVTLDRVFEPFFTTKGVGDGTGLGLSVVHGIVNGHGGTITVRSTPGKGSEFILSLPPINQHQTTAAIETAAA